MIQVVVFLSTSFVHPCVFGKGCKVVSIDVFFVMLKTRGKALALLEGRN